MDSLIQLASQMQWPFAIAVIGISGALAVPIVVRRLTRTRLELARAETDEKVALAQVKVSVRNGLVEQ